MKQDGECEHCGAPQPILGEIEHAWDCHRGDQWLARKLNAPLPDSKWIESEEDLARVARTIAAGWASKFEKSDLNCLDVRRSVTTYN